ncbi:MAG: M20/M25/M40 family metallo-hydrolase [Myxococcaceae bacterium]|nr:M20/M25/M40 family metallo-hydrolase [Myxococcaceae bacterium]
MSLGLIAALSLTAAPDTRLITPEAIRGHIRFLASDALEGRGPATKGDQLAQAYIASQFEMAGLKPMGTGGSWYQPFDIVGIDGHPAELKVSGGKNGSITLKFWDDLIAVAGEHQELSKLDLSDLVFVGYGIQAAEYQWDDFKGVDVKGKTLLVMNSDPEDDPKLFAGKTRLWYGRWDYKYEMAQKLGAAACIIIHTTPSAGYPWQVVQTSWTGEQFDLPYTDAQRLKVKGWVTEDAAKKIAKAAGQDLDVLRRAAQSRDFRPVPLGLQVTTSFKNVVQKKQTANVVGLLPGSDPKLARELVVYTAHHDHLGKKSEGKPGEDVIYNGAVDNASGVAAMLTVLRAFGGQPKAPKRGILFAAVAAEEQGLLGSQYLVEHPPAAMGLMAVDINIDGANIWGRTKDVSVIGLGKSNVDDVIIKLARAQGRVVKPDELSDRGFFYRSDQYNFARWGVPAAYFSSGHDFIGKPDGWGKKMREEWEDKNYHQPSDELTDSWELSGAVEDVQLYFELGLEIANASKMPAWNKGDEFELARLKALQAVTAGK